MFPAVSAGVGVVGGARAGLKESLIQRPLVAGNAHGDTVPGLAKRGSHVPLVCQRVVSGSKSNVPNEQGSNRQSRTQILLKHTTLRKCEVGEIHSSITTSPLGVKSSVLLLVFVFVLVEKSREQFARGRETPIQCHFRISMARVKFYHRVNGVSVGKKCWLVKEIHGSVVLQPWWPLNAKHLPFMHMTMTFQILEIGRCANRWLGRLRESCAIFYPRFRCNVRWWSGFRFVWCRPRLAGIIRWQRS